MLRSGFTFLFGFLLTLASLCDGADPDVELAAKQRLFDVECQLVDASGGKRQVLARPKLRVVEHQKATISTCAQRPFVVAVTAVADDAHQPVIEVLNEGWTADLCCHHSGKRHIAVDLAVEISHIDDVAVKQLDGDISVQQPRVRIQKIRVIETALPGEQFVVPLDGKPRDASQRYLALTVRGV